MREKKVSTQALVDLSVRAAEAESAPSALSPDARVDFVVVTALAEERDAILKELPDCRKLPPSEEDIRTYFQSDLPVTFPNGSTGKYSVIVMCLLGMGRVQAATATSDAIRRWRPRYVLLVGIAGGIAARNVRIGDILISDQIVDYELQKVTPQGPEIRWEVQRADSRLLNACNNYQDEDWKKTIQIKRPDKRQPARHIGPIASGDKVIAFAEILAGYRDIWTKLVGVEMEAAGVATAAFQATEKPGFFMVRGVSDLADENKGSKNVQKWRSYACAVAASFAVSLLKSGPVPLANDSVPIKGASEKNKIISLAGSIEVGGHVTDSVLIIADKINSSSRGWDLPKGNTKLSDLKGIKDFFLSGEEKQVAPIDALDKDLHFSPLLLGPLIQNYNKYQQMAEELEDARNRDQDGFYFYNQESVMAAIRQASPSRRVVELHGPSGIGKSHVIKAILSERDKGRYAPDKWRRWKYVAIEPKNNFEELMEEFIREMGSPHKPDHVSLQEGLAQCISERMGVEKFDHLLFVIDSVDNIEEQTLRRIVGEDGPAGSKVQAALPISYPDLTLRLLISTRRPRFSESYCLNHNIQRGVHQISLDALDIDHVREMFYDRLRPELRQNQDYLDHATEHIYEITGGHPGAVAQILWELRNRYQFALQPDQFIERFLPSVLWMVQKDIISDLSLQEYFLGNILSVLRHFSTGLIIKLFEANLLPSNIVSFQSPDIDKNIAVRNWLDHLCESPALVRKVAGDLALFQIHPILRHVLPMDLKWQWKEYLCQLHHAIFTVYDQQLRARLPDEIRLQLSFTYRPTYTIEALYHLFQYLALGTDSFSDSELAKAASDYFDLYAEAYSEEQDTNRDPYALRDKWTNEIELKYRIQQTPDSQSILPQLEKILTEIP